MREYAKLKDFDECEKFLLEHPQLCSYTSFGYLTVDAFKSANELQVS